jgi:hemoglobin-like flavoprotein
MALNVPLLRSSLETAVENEGIVTMRFYEILFSRYPQVEGLFGRNSRENQAKMLQESLVAVLEHVEDAEWLQSTLSSMGKKHLEYDVTEDMYPWVGECLVAALGEAVGDSWTDEHVAAWSEAYGVISGMMIEGARAAS